MPLQKLLPWLWEYPPVVSILEKQPTMHFHQNSFHWTAV